MGSGGGLAILQSVDAEENVLKPWFISPMYSVTCTNTSRMGCVTDQLQPRERLGRSRDPCPFLCGGGSLGGECHRGGHSPGKACCCPSLPQAALGDKAENSTLSSLYSTPVPGDECWSYEQNLPPGKSCLGLN